MTEISKAKQNRFGPEMILIYSSYAELFNKLLAIVALGVGAFWMWSNFNLTRTGEWALDVRLSPKIVSEEQDRSLVVFDASIKNVGKVVVYPTTKEGIVLTVYELANTKTINEVIDPHTKTLVEFDISSRYGSSKDSENKEMYNYIIEPGADYHESEAVYLKRGKLYGVSIVVRSTSGSKMRDYEYIYVK